MNEFLALYIGLTVFGAGVTLIDLFGMAFSHGANGHDGSHHGGGHDSAGNQGPDHDTSLDHGGSHPTHQDPAETAHQAALNKESVVVHDSAKKNPVLSVLSALRNIVYFSLGFGPVGWFIMGSGIDFVQSLVVSVPVGVVVLAGVRMLRRIQTRRLDSQVQESDFLMEKAEVTVGIEKGQMGKVRVSLSGRYLERYAKASDVSHAFPKGTVVRIVSMTDEGVIVEEE